MPRVVAAVSALSSNADTAYWVVSGEMLGLVLLFQALFKIFILTPGVHGEFKFAVHSQAADGHHSVNISHYRLSVSVGGATASVALRAGRPHASSE